MPSRQFHGKSRHGCKTCKKRKVRCDLARPICNNCTRLSRECFYAEQLLPDLPQSEKSSPLAHRLPSRSPHVTVEGPYQPTLLDLELLHHFTVSTALSHTENPLHMPLWTTTIPYLSFSHPFLLHGILSISALHKRSFPDIGEFHSSTLLSTARHHQQAALELYIPLLSDVNASNTHALFAFSQIIAAVSYALLQLNPGQTSADEFLASVISAFDLLIGAVAIAIRGREWLRAGPLAALLGHGPQLLDWNMLPLADPPKSQLDALVLRLQNHTSPGPGPGPAHRSPDSTAEVNPPTSMEADCTVAAIQKLHPLFPRAPAKASVTSIVGWPVFLDAMFIELLKRRDDAALVVLAFYGVALSKLDHVWWVRGLGRRVVEAVGEVVGEEWRGELGWAREGVGVDGG